MKRLTYKIDDGKGISYITHPDNTKGHRECLNKLGELENAEEEGRLIVLPCKVGETVYLITEGQIEPYNLCHTFHYVVLLNEHCEELRSVGLMNFGKTVFLTYEAAENALKARESLEEQDS